MPFSGLQSLRCRHARHRDAKAGGRELKPQEQEQGPRRPPGPDQRLTPLHLIEYGAVRVVGWLVRLLPLTWALAFGRCLGRLWYAVDRRHRKVTLINLDLVFQNTKSEAEKRDIRRRVFQHFGTVVVEILRFPKINPRNFLKLVELDHIGPLYEALDRGKGLILCAAHYGNWEIMGLALGYLNRPLSVMARPFNNPLIHNYMERLRCRSGNRVIYKHGSIRKVISDLRENRIVGIVNDQDVGDHNRIFSPFFGLDASVSPVPAAIALKTGAPIITGFAVPQGRGRYVLRFGDLIYGDPKADKDAEIQRITRILNQRLERQIQFQPEYWMWVHKRFKTTPQGLRSAYDQPREMPEKSTN